MLVEATAGNTGLGLALVAAQKGYRLILVIPDKMSREKVLHLKALGAEVVMTRSDVGKGHPQYYQDLAEKITRETPRAFYVNQFNNPANPAGPRDAPPARKSGRRPASSVDAIVCGVGSGGTITGLEPLLRPRGPASRNGAGRSAGLGPGRIMSRAGRLGEAGSWLVEGIGEDFVPPIADLSRVRTAYRIGDAESLSTARALLKQEGILAGASSGTLVAAALRYCREQIRAEAGGHPRVRLGRQVPLENVRRLLDGRPGLSDHRGLWRSARRHQPSVCRRGRR